MTDRLTPAEWLRDLARLIDLDKYPDGIGQTSLGDTLREEAARREAEAEDEYGLTKEDRARGAVSPKEMRQMLGAAAPPPPAPDDLVTMWRGKIEHARRCGYPDHAIREIKYVSAIESLRARAEAAEAEVSKLKADAVSLESIIAGLERQLDGPKGARAFRYAAEADAKRLRDALAGALRWADRHGKEPDWLEQARNALAGGNDA